jgi:hypothetical protein
VKKIFLFVKKFISRKMATSTMQSPRIDPEAGTRMRARNSSHAANTDNKDSKKKSKRKKDSERKETVCTIVAKELDPRSIVQWPRMFWHSSIRVLQVFAMIRHIRIGDVIAGLVNTALLFTFAAVFSSGTLTRRNRAFTYLLGCR